MSSPDGHGETGQNLTIIVIPHDGLETRTFVISYRSARLAMYAAIALAAVIAIAMAALFPVMIQAARARDLEQQIQVLERDRAKVAELAQTLREVEEQYEKVRQMLGADAPFGSDSVPVLPPLRGGSRPDTLTPEEPEPISLDTWPLEIPGYITRGVSDGRSRHPGLDIAVPTNSYVRAASAGVIRAAGIDDVYGHYVVIDHGEGLETVYGHASRLLVTAGDEVASGDVIALTGSTGRSTAPHLHFEVRRDGRAVDPQRYIRQP
jgi:murein DD-endopeptidase MepM/ murein hydrolase activator NlpD